MGKLKSTPKPWWRHWGLPLVGLIVFLIVILIAYTTPITPRSSPTTSTTTVSQSFTPPPQYDTQDENQKKKDDDEYSQNEKRHKRRQRRLQTRSTADTPTEDFDDQFFPYNEANFITKPYKSGVAQCHLERGGGIRCTPLIRNVRWREPLEDVFVYDTDLPPSQLTCQFTAPPSPCLSLENEN